MRQRRINSNVSLERVRRFKKKGFSEDVRKLTLNETGDGNQNEFMT